MNKRLILILITAPVFCFSMFSFSSAEITQKYGSPYLSISNFVAVSSGQSGDLLTRTFKLTVENTGESPVEKYNLCPSRQPIGGGDGLTSARRSVLQ